MPGEVTNPETKDKYLVGSLIEEAISSSQIEGAATTRKIAQDMIRTGRKPRDRSERMILNNYRTMSRIGELKDRSMTPELVLEIHRLVTEGTLDDSSAAGRLRRPGEAVEISDESGQVFHVPPSAESLAERMAAMCDFADGKTPQGFIHPVIRSIILHFWLAYDHPFIDGNGRTARALFYWSMLRNGFWLFEFVSISHIIHKSHTKYGRAFLYTETDDNDLTYFIIYNLNVMHRAVEALYAYIARKAKETAEIQKELHHIQAPNHRQHDLISHALRHPNYRYTIEGHRVTHNIVYQTARTDLPDLTERGLFEKKKAGKSLHFTAVADLREKLPGLGRERSV